GNKDRLRQRLIDADANHVISGISSINFDSIARERVFEAISSAKLDSRANLKQAYLALKARVGRVPLLLDFARQNTVDPETIGTKMGNYAMFVQWADKDALGEWVLPEPGNATL